MEPGTLHADVTDRHRYNDSRIEMLDPESGELLASASHDTVFNRFIADDLLIASVFDEGGRASGGGMENFAGRRPMRRLTVAES